MGDTISCEEKKWIMETRKKILDDLPKGTEKATRDFLSKQYEEAKKKYEDCQRGE